MSESADFFTNPSETVRLPDFENHNNTNRANDEPTQAVFAVHKLHTDTFFPYTFCQEISDDPDPCYKTGTQHYSIVLPNSDPNFLYALWPLTGWCREERVTIMPEQK